MLFSWERVNWYMFTPGTVTKTNLRNSSTQICFGESLSSLWLFIEEKMRESLTGTWVRSHLQEHGWVVIHGGLIRGYSQEHGWEGSLMGSWLGVIHRGSVRGHLWGTWLGVAHRSIGEEEVIGTCWEVTHRGMGEGLSQGHERRVLTGALERGNLQEQKWWVTHRFFTKRLRSAKAISHKICLLGSLSSL